MVPVSCDYAIWAEHSADRVQGLASLRERRPEIKALALWVDGKISDRGLDELKKRDIEVVSNVLEPLSKPSS